MTALQTSADSLRALARGLREPRIYLALLVALLLWVAAYQNKRDYKVDVADLKSNPYLTGFNDIEQSATDPTLLYRWSTASPSVSFPGIGNQPVQVSITTIGSRPGGDPPLIQFTARGQQFQLQTQPAEDTKTFFVDRGPAPFEGDLTLRFSVPPFTPVGDPRELGVIIKGVLVQPASYGLRPPVIPPLGTLALLLVSVAAVYALVLLLSHKRRWALLAVWACTLLVTLGILFARPDTALLADQLPLLLAWTVLLGLAAQFLTARLLNAQRGALSSAPLALALLAFAIAFAVRYGGLIYPQFRTSDLLLHVHNVQDVLAGNLVFTEPLPDGRPVPYPPAYYLLVSLLSVFTGASDNGLALALKWSASLLDAATCLALFWAASRLSHSRRTLSPAGAFAAIIYLALPGVFDLFSAGNYTNLFAQSLLNITLLGALVFLADAKSVGRLAPVLLTLGFALTMLGHYGMMLGALGILGIFALWTLVRTLQKSDKANDLGRSWAVLSSAGAALLGSFALYYWRFVPNMAGQFGDFLGKLSNGTPQPAPAAVKPSFGESLLKLPAKAEQLIGAFATTAAVAGGLLFSRTPSAARALLISWLLAGLALAFLDQAVGDSVRWYYLAAAPVALAAGRFLSLLHVRRRPARLLTALVLLAVLMQMLTFWVGLIYTRYH